jgi:hypothetical protein
MKKNPSAVALGKLGRGVPKDYTPEERRRRAAMARGLRQRNLYPYGRCACGAAVGAGVGDGLCVDCRFRERGK